MAGLNSLLSDVQQTQTTLPSWYDQAQQNIVQQGTQAAAAAPQLGQTVAQGAINTLQPGAQNPFTQAQNTLQQISSGAANPWITDASGNVTPNTQTALGGLFSAEQNQLNQILPSISAPSQATGIGAGQFGSLRSQTAVDKAKGDAFSNLMAQQMQAALSAQQTGQQAAANLGNVANQGINAQMNVGMAQQNAPFQNVGNLASLLGTIQAPTTVTAQKQMSPLTQAATIANTLQGTGIAGGLGSLLFGNAASGNNPATGGLLGTGGAGNILSNLLKSNSSNAASDPFRGGGTGTMVNNAGQVVPDPTYGNISNSSVMQNPDFNPYENPI